MQFRASYDRTTSVLSAIVAVLFAAVAAVAPWFVAVLGLAVLAIAYAYSPRGYMVAEGGIEIHRLAGRVRIRLDAVRLARLATPEDLSGTLRLWGSGGLFGYYGLFRTSRLGRCWWYVTRRDRMTVVATDSVTYVLSPDDTDGFLRTVQPHARREAGTFEIPARKVGSLAWVIAGALTLIALAAVGVGLVYDPGLPEYTLTRTTLEIHDRFYPVTLGARDVDVSGVRVVDLMASPEWQPAEKTNGFANPNYRSGWFRSAGGTEMRLYQAKGWRLVLFPESGGGAPVLLEVGDPEGFVERVRREWGAL